MLFKSALLTSASGSINGITASRNKGGQYFRARSIPVNPNSTAQQSQRTAFSTASAAWVNVLTQAQRDAWAAFATNWPATNALGDAIQLSGQQAFIQTNSFRLRFGKALQADAPNSTAVPTLELDVPTLTEDGTIAWNLTSGGSNSWASEAAGFATVFVSRPQSPGVTFFKGPFQSGGATDGNASTPPTSLAGTSPFTQLEDDIVYLRARACSGDGRLSAAIIERITVSP